MSSIEQTTEDRLLVAAIDLMYKKGYKAATTKEIAEAASVSEMTLFRKFGSKKAMIDKAISKYSYVMSMKEILHEKITYDLVHDLILISETYQLYMEKNKKIAFLAMREWSTNPEIAVKTSENPKLLKQFLSTYFLEMQQRGKLIDINIEVQVMAFLWMNLGYFMAKFIAGDNVAKVPEDIYIKESVNTFARGLSK